MHNFTITELIDGLKKKVFSSAEITQHFLARIKNLDSEFNSVITLTEDQALESAKLADQLLADGRAPELCGIPVLHKDIFAPKAFAQAVVQRCWIILYHPMMQPLSKTSKTVAQSC